VLDFNICYANALARRFMAVTDAKAHSRENAVAFMASIMVMVRRQLDHGCAASTTQLQVCFCGRVSRELRATVRVRA